MMKKSWADCSSDEEEDDYSVDSPDQEEALDTAASNKLHIDNENSPNQEMQQSSRTYDYPDQPPFTAFVGNLSFDVQEASYLRQALADVVQDRLGGERINTIGGQICYDRNSKNKQHRGFGYVELETLEELKIVMKLNDDAQATLAGRKVQVGTANSQNRSNSRGSQYNNNNNNRGSFDNGNHRHNHPQSGRKNNNSHVEIDGSKFRGGKYSNHNDNNNNTINNSFNSHQKNSFRNNTNHVDSQSYPRERGGSLSHKQHDINTNKDTPSAPPKRPSLKLAPRSKPVDGTERRASSSNIFGGAKARDEQAWEKNRRTSQQQEQIKEVKDQTLTDTTNSKDLDNEKTKKDKQLSDVTGGGDSSNTTDNNTVNKKDEKKADVWASVDSVATNKKKGHKLSHQLERRQSSRGEGRGGKNRGGRGSNNGRVNHEKDDHINRNHKRGSGRRQSQQQQQQQQQQHKKQEKRRQQPSPEEKAAAEAAADKTKNLTSKNSGTANIVPHAPSKKEIKTPRNSFSLLMDSDSE
mmetsp:Transcript_50496/g.56340  ORF Transcript_50496/g.56340 Transcript_50496/m.56340 type:complete len:522 (+) Transcript_50496:136-1701(+)|eukprot:CAMPEP_0170809752 /NCGR_PEP_ID=MMETSP0733-20121128/34218_1 /TAXON_ID=186038 /ORGANISM="Fragilariopsis kerguelensis, Strain L26-C5" /LENGTH=521 /DNA_ID=CAMNT_0011165515 /DNA_START=33 /DNA_END=1598 /DNA_ORIENTATION=-